MANIIIDEPNLPQVEFSGGQWTNTSDNRYFGGSSTAPAFATGSQLASDKWGWFCFQFTGTSVAVFGNSAPPPGSQNFFASIDGGTPVNTTYNDTSPSSSLQWYQSPTLAEGTHLINFTHLAGPSVDYVVVTAGKQTPLKDTRLIVDDDDASIQYQGNWNQDTSALSFSGTPSHGQAFGNGTHRATSAGPKATFVYTGTALSVYGVFDFRQLGNLTVKYTLDTWTTTKTYAVTIDTPSVKNGAQQVQNFQLFTYSSVDPGDHTLTMEVLESNNVPFIVDYITYTPTFTNAASKPSLAFPSATSSGGSDPGSANSGGKSKAPIGAIVGGVVGGVIVLLAILLAFLYWRRQKRRPKGGKSVDLDSEEPKGVQPFTLTTNARSEATSPPDSATKPLFGVPPTPGTISSFGMDSPPTSPPYTSAFPAVTAHTKGGSQPLVDITEEASSDNGDQRDSRLQDPQFRRRMQRLQDLVLELNQEIEASGENGTRVAALRGRIAELTREDAESAELITRTLVSNERPLSVVPPPYEAD